MWSKCLVLLIACNICAFALDIRFDKRSGDEHDGWKGNWFPAKPGTVDQNPVISNSDDDLHDVHHGVKMGVSNIRCDDAKTNLTVDWDGSPEAYRCLDYKYLYMPDANRNPFASCDHIPRNYWALHACMNTTIEYNVDIPTFGTHRPLWARWGEYKYLPVQRWLHNLEHGGIVMLYHPCAAKQEVRKLRNLVKKCLYRHVITPYNKLTPERPLALLAWGCRLTMSKVDAEVVTSFIKQHALNGPEKISRDGQYDFQLRTPAETITDTEDSQLCPTF